MDICVWTSSTELLSHASFYPKYLPRNTDFSGGWWRQSGISNLAVSFNSAWQENEIRWFPPVLKCYSDVLVSTMQCLGSGTIRWGHGPAPEGRNNSAMVLTKGSWGGDCEKAGDHDGSQGTAVSEWAPRAHPSDEFGLHPVHWHQWVMWRLGLSRETWFYFLST